jgi:tetratricopeptide (TPR) repeat protein
LHTKGCLPTRLSIPTAVITLAAFLAAADTCAAQNADALARAGTAAIESRRFGDALKRFTRAAEMRPGDASLCFGAGVSAFMLGQDDLAQSHFECALALNPGFLPAAVWLGDLHYRAGRLAEAISIYETAGRSPGGREVQAQLADWRREYELQRRLREIRTPHFTALFEAAGDEPFAREILDRLEAAYWRIGKALGVYPSRPIGVVLYTREQFVEVTRLAPWSAAAFDGRIRLPLAGAPYAPEDLDRVLSHEFVHVVVAAVGGRTVPAWMNEGLATMLEPAGPGDMEAMLARTPMLPALSTLHRSFVGLSTRDAEIAYGSAVRATRRLIQQRGMVALVALLQDLARGAPFADAFERRIAMRYQEFASLLSRD